ncbi:hypothetical protein [Trichothermofontia sp.]
MLHLVTPKSLNQVNEALLKNLEIATTLILVVGVCLALLTQQWLYLVLALSLMFWLSLREQRRLSLSLEQLQNRYGTLTTAIATTRDRLDRVEQSNLTLQTTLSAHDTTSQAITSLTDSYYSTLRRLIALEDSVSEVQSRQDDCILMLDNFQRSLEIIQDFHGYTTDLKIEAAMSQYLEQIEAALGALQRQADYSLLKGYEANRTALLTALDQVKGRLTMACPCLMDSPIDDDIIAKMRQLLAEGKHIETGWGLMRGIQSGIPNHEGPLYSALPKLRELQQAYPTQLILKLISTHEKFLVCDQRVALVGSHHFLASRTAFPDYELSLKTTDPVIVHNLLQYFEQAPELKQFVRRRSAA